MESNNKKLDAILNLKIKNLLDLIENVNFQIKKLENDNSEFNNFLIVQFNYQKVDFLKEICQILISSNLATTKQIDNLLDTIFSLNNADLEKKEKEPFKKQLNRLDFMITEEKFHLKKTI